MQAVILAGGKGTRLAPYTRVLPKPLMPICDMPILEVLLRQMKRAGVSEAVLTVGYLDGLLRSYFGDGRRLGLRIRYSHETCPLGTVGPLALIEGLEDTFLVSNGDVLTTLDPASLFAFHRRLGGIATIAIHQRRVPIHHGVLRSGEDARITAYEEKPVLEYSASMGMYVFERRVLEYIPARQRLDLPDLINRLLAAGEKVAGYPFDGYWQDLGNPADYRQATQDFERMRPQFLGDD